jgi:3-oxoadipate enol-lactonase
MKLWALTAGPENDLTPVVFLHAFPMDSRMWRSQVRFVAKKRRAVAPDARGYGNSKTADEITFTVPGYADDVIETLDELGVRRAIFCGCSMGGYAMFELWRRHRGRVAGMILCDTRAEADAPPAKQKRAQQIARIREEGAGFMVDFVAENLLGKRTRDTAPDIVGEVRQWASEAPAATIAANLQGLADRTDSGDSLPAIDVPTLVIVGQEDTITPLDAASRLAREIPHARLVVIPDAGHLSPVENPTAVNAAIAAYLEETRL